MSKRFKGKTCTYCCDLEASAVGDHVLAREFCLKDKRDNLPQVPACDPCNNEKSSLETYLTAVAPFGARHVDSSTNLTTLVAPRIARNRKLQQSLSAGMEAHFESRDGINWVESRTLPFEARKLLRLYEMMAQGLAYHHWQLLLPADRCLIHGSFFTAFGAKLFEAMFSTRAIDKRVIGDLSDGVLRYEGVQDPHHSELTAWRMSLYGAVLGGAPNAPTERPSCAYVLTTPRELAAGVGFIETLKKQVASAA